MLYFQKIIYLFQQKDFYYKNHLFSKAEKDILVKSYIDYRKSKQEDLVENFTLSNLFNEKNKSDKEYNNIESKSSLLAPFNSLNYEYFNINADDIHKNKIFNQLCEQEAQRQAEKDYWENVRNELYLEQGNKKRKMEEQAEKEKRERQKEEMMASALLHKKIKEENKIKEQEQEKEFRVK